MIGSPFKITNKNNTALFFDMNDQLINPSNFIALQSYPSMDVEIRNDEIIKQGQHGVWDFYSFYGKRIMTFEGVIIGDNEDEAQTLAQKMELVTTLPSQPSLTNNGTVLITWTDPTGRDLQIEGKLQASIKFARQMHQKYRLDFIMTIKCPNSALQSQDVLDVAGIRSWQMGALNLPTTLPTNSPVVRENLFEINNLGSLASNPTIKLYGSSLFALNNPRITNETTGQFMQVNITLADETEYVEINSETGAIIDQDSNDVSGSIEIGSTFLYIETGVNELYYTTDESDSDNPLNPVADRQTPLAVVEIAYRENF